MDELLNRSVEVIYPSRQALAARLAKDEPLTIYYGIDPTGPNIHLGHAVPLWKLREFQDLGHKVILLIGDFTAMVGDPTDKGAARVRLTREQVLENSKNYLDQVAKILDLTKTTVRHNSEWLAKLNQADLMDLMAHFTTAQMLERDMFQKRLVDGAPIYLHEFLYPIMQGYDSVALNVDMEIGGNDQIFNMLIGRDLLKSLKNKEKFVLATKLLAVPGEVKMGKTENNMISLTDAPNEMYGKIMSWPDSILPLAFELCTRLTTAAYESILVGSPHEAKAQLARSVVTLYHGAPAATAAQAAFERTFGAREFPADTAVVVAITGTSLSQLLLDNGLVESKSDFERLINQGAIKEENNNKITDRHFTITNNLKLKIGKHRFLEIKIKT